MDTLKQTNQNPKKRKEQKNNMTRRITDKKMQVLRFIYDYIKSNDRAPAMKEIAKALDIPCGLAQYRKQELIGHGCLRKDEAGPYGNNLVLTKKGILACKSDK